jgi:hypothetical protein
MVFRAIEFDEPGTASFSFTPVKIGTFKFTVGEAPSFLGQPVGQAGGVNDPKLQMGRFVVK